MKKLKVLINGAIIKDGKLLLAKRIDINKWELPGGKVEDGEQPKDTIVRELEEELKLKGSIKNILDSYSSFFDWNGDSHLVVHVTYLIEPNSDAVLDKELHSELAWFSKGQIAKLLSSKRDILENEYAFGLEHIFKTLLDGGILK